MRGDEDQMMGGAGTATHGSEPGLDDPGEKTSRDPLAEAIADGEYRHALLLCAREHGAAIGRLCMAMVGTQAEADDLLQETLLTAHEGFGGYRREGSVRAWLFGIARKKCLHHLEKQRRQQTRLRLVGPAERADVEEQSMLRERAERARGALESIKPTEREALLLRYIGQLSFEEVAHACGIEEAAARKRVSRALLRLRSQLGTE